MVHFYKKHQQDSCDLPQRNTDACNNNEITSVISHHLAIGCTTTANNQWEQHQKQHEDNWGNIIMDVAALLATRKQWQQHQSNDNSNESHNVTKVIRHKISMQLMKKLHRQQQMLTSINDNNTERQQQQSNHNSNESPNIKKVIRRKVILSRQAEEQQWQWHEEKKVKKFVGPGLHIKSHCS